jgi:TonB family protein
MSLVLRNSLKLALLVALCSGLGGTVVFAQQTTADAKGPAVSGSSNLTQAQIDDIIRKFATKETEFRAALNSYAFKRDALIQTIGMGGQVTGEYHRVSSFTFDDHGNRFEKINYFPMPSFGGVTQEDLEDLGGVNPFALEAARINQYTFKYAGKERIDELDLYVFDVAPRITPDSKKKERFFVGRIWVDDRDLQIVKSKGKAVPETKINKFPIVETYREQIDGRYWFPTYAYADDDLIFDNGTDMRIRMQIKYTDFVVGRGKVTITEVGEAPEQIKPETPSTPDKVEPKPTASPTPPVSSPASTPSQTKTSPATSGDEQDARDVGFLNGRAVDLPKPVYPAEAKKSHITGQVQVKVILDQQGKVISAEAVFGPEELRAAAVAAAKRARFQPTVMDGVAVKVFGIITYDFVEP